MWKNSDNVSTRVEGWAPVLSADSLSAWSRDCIVANSTAVISRFNRTKCLTILRLLQVLGLTRMRARAHLCGGGGWRTAEKNSFSGTVWILRGAIPQRKQLLSRLKGSGIQGWRFTLSCIPLWLDIGSGHGNCLMVSFCNLNHICVCGMGTEHETTFKFLPDSMSSCFLMDLFCQVHQLNACKPWDRGSWPANFFSFLFWHNTVDGYCRRWRLCPSL